MYSMRSPRISPQPTHGANVQMVKDMASKLKVPIQVLDENETWIRARYSVREGIEEKACQFPVFDYQVPSSKYRLDQNISLISFIIKYGAEKLLTKSPFKEINAVCPLKCVEFVMEYKTEGDKPCSIYVSTIRSDSFCIPKPKVENQRIDLNISCLIVPTKETVPKPQCNQPTLDKQRTQQQKDTRIFKELLKDKAYSSYQIPFEDRRRELSDLVTRTDEDGVTLVSSLNLFTTKIVRDRKGNIHIFQPTISPHKNKQTGIPEMINSPVGGPVKWVKTNTVEVPIIHLDDDQMAKTTKIVEKTIQRADPPQVPTEASVSQPSHRDYESSPPPQPDDEIVPEKSKANDESDSDSDSSSDYGPDADHCKRTDRYSDSENGADDPDQYPLEEEISLFYSRPSKECADYGSENVYKEAISVYQSSFKDWKTETCEYIKMLPMKTAFHLFCVDKTNFPCEAHMTREIINLMRRSGAYYRLFSEEELDQLTDTEKAHIYIAQIATDNSQRNALGLLDHVSLVREAVTNYRKFWPNAKVSTTERIKQLPYDRLRQIFFQNKLPPRTFVIHYIKLLMDSEERDRDHVNYLLRIPNYLEKLPTETLHRIFFIKLAMEGQYKIFIASNDVFHPDVIKANQSAKTANMSALKLNKPLQTIRPKVEPGDEIPEPPEMIQLEGPEPLLQYQIDIYRRQLYLEALDYDSNLASLPDNERNRQMRQNIIYSRKWPNYNTTLNFFKPLGTQDLSPCVINQLDSLPMPFNVQSWEEEPTYIDVGHEHRPQTPQDPNYDVASGEFIEENHERYEKIITVEINPNYQRSDSVNTTYSRKRQYSTSSDEDEQDPKRISDDNEKSDSNKEDK